MADITCSGVTKVYADGTVAVQELDLVVEDGQLAVLVGPSGCGKTTLLRMVAGLEQISGGTISLGGHVVNELSAKQRDVAMVFQNYALYPHMSVYDNMAYSLKIRKQPKAEIRRKVEDAAAILGLGDLLTKKPRHLSGGQRQRVAMGRAIVRSPRAFLMDEPLSNLDAKLRTQMRGEIHRIQRSLGVTTMYVTHDQAEAITLGDVVAVMRKGVLQQVDSPERVYTHPASTFVAGFIGSPAMNMVSARLARADGGLAVEFGSNRIVVPEAVARARPALAGYVGEELVLGVRPEHIEDAAFTGHEPFRALLDGTVDLRENLGSEVHLSFTVDARPVFSDEMSDGEAGDRVAMTQSMTNPVTERRSLFVARVDSQSACREGDVVRAAIDVRHLYFFDPRSGAAIYGGDEPSAAG